MSNEKMNFRAAPPLWRRTRRDLGAKRAASLGAKRAATLGGERAATLGAERAATLGAARLNSRRRAAKMQPDARPRRLWELAS
jgi:hypothetical protein